MKKTLPIVNAPTLVCKLPVSGITVKYRPFVVKEQKALLLAKDSTDHDSIIETIKSVMESCTDGTLDFDKATVDDIAYFFLQLRIASVGPDVKFTIPCVSCSEPVLMNLDLTGIGIDVSDAINDVKITDSIGIRFRFPTFEDTVAIDAMESSSRGVGMIKRLIEYIYDDEQVFDKSEYSDSELEEWILGLNEQQLTRIDDFLNRIPHLKHELNFKCPHCKTEQSRLVEGLHNFFRLGSPS
jgi:hypothetical protein